jgi:hypothetical protein
MAMYGWRKTGHVWGRLDFTALLVLTNELLMKKPVLSKQIRTVYAHICVD